MRRAGLALLVAASAACGIESSTHADGGTPLDIDAGGISFRVEDGVVTASAQLRTFHLLSVRPGCDALTYLPRFPVSELALTVAPAADGGTHATVVSGTSAPGPGEAVGGLTRSLQGTVQASLAATDGTVDWTVAADGGVTVQALDIGFGATEARVSATSFALSRCGY